jgi:hypothetical protein
MKAKAVEQYLQRYAEPEIAWLNHWQPLNRGHNFSNSVVIPAFKESTEFLDKLLLAPWYTNDILVILVINQPPSPADLTTQSNLYNAQQALFDYAHQKAKSCWQQGNLTLLNYIHEDQSARQLLIVDRFSQPIAIDHGVGLARKIGADIAVWLIQQGVISNPWIGSTDADATLPHNYFHALRQIEDEKIVGCCFDFLHIADATTSPEVLEATQQYEQAMRYYVAGLTYAGSPYALFSIGSTIAFSAEGYAKVRGFPKRPAGEDFYLLNKLTKIGDIQQLSTATILLNARLSDRVPFGTGVSAAKIIEDNRLGKPFCYYHPQIFVELKTVLSHFVKLYQHQDTLHTWLQSLSPISAQALQQLGLQAFLAKQQKQPNSSVQFTKNLQDWFDGLKTLRFIHILRDEMPEVYGNIPLDGIDDAWQFPLTLIN